MIEFLKESTFATNEVIGKAWAVTKKNYFSIATLCFLMFITSNASGLMAFFLKDVNMGLSVLMAFFFIMFYFTINLSLFKYIFHLLDDDLNVSIVSTIPTRKQIIRFLVAMLYFMLCIIGVYSLVILIAFPFIYLGINMDIITNIAISVGIIAIFITWIRISFFPFFIIDKNLPPFSSIKFSLAITKGNFTKILLLLLVLGGFHLLYLFVSYLQWPVIAFFINVLSSFIVVPLSSVALTIAYRKMMSEYKGEGEPDIIHNIV
ncbi:hypothetical protein FBD94_02370 [Pedobacter hiemivivus]|uniref:Beta-carotene 15,15'-monooxygenase n=1 Tax=Pedobacter hiemivivus TaxID=2530454 RepID=A0A4R0MSL1_9SPHI|nr:hypothetical protein [Pedobacter hiemivivus]TCC89985.1 hypothetical protein EZ444_20675 [Pedobacter hiemivivus]TKC65418.1 hypothetical protein FBD94_02370 [Pedobacter hiemivivus]